MHFLKFAFFGALAAQVAAVPSPASHVLHERRNFVPKAFVKRGRVDASAWLPIRVGMKQSNLDKGHDMLMDVSQHDSPNYGKHYTAEQVTEIFAPAQATVDAVREWLVSAGIRAEKISQSVNKQWMQFDASALELESLLQTEFHEYEHTATGILTVACDEYHVPAHIQEHVDYITPGIILAGPSRQDGAGLGLEKRTFGVTGGQKLPPILKSIADLGSTIEEILGAIELLGCSVAITPPCIKALYKVTQPTKAAPSNAMGIFEDLGDYYSQTDLNLFFATFAQNIPQGTGPKLEGIDGATAPVAVTSAGPESDLDFQVTYPLIYPQGTVLFQTDDAVYEANYTFEGFLNNFLYAIDGSYCKNFSSLDPPYPDPSNATGAYKGNLWCGVYKPTNVISISYGGAEADLPASYQQRQCAEFMKLGMQGTSVVLASGDSGVASAAGDQGNSDGCLGSTGSIFNPDFPATCPYITTVGSTTLPTGGDVNTDAETSTTRFASGGGFSNIYPIPDYQKNAVSTYLTAHTPPYKSYSATNDQGIGANGGIYNNAGRGYPDVSAVGDNIIIYNMGAPTLIGGTSASAPIFASILNRINEERIAANKSTVGFVNPTLYANPQVLHDITTGTNPGCNTNGFSASTGWDPLSGLGTPMYPQMLSLFMSLQ